MGSTSFRPQRTDQRFQGENTQKILQFPDFSFPAVTLANDDSDRALEVIPHGLGYVPAYLAYYLRPNFQFVDFPEYPSEAYAGVVDSVNFSASEGNAFISLEIGADSTNLYVGCVRSNVTGTDFTFAELPLLIYIYQQAAR